MTREEAIKHLETYSTTNGSGQTTQAQHEQAKRMAIKTLEQEPCEDVPEINVGDIISRQAVLDKKELVELEDGQSFYCISPEDVETLPPVTPQPKTGHCKDCKYFEYDSVAKVDEIPLIVAHEICSRWGDGCKTSEDGYCFLFEPQERSNKE